MSRPRQNSLPKYLELNPHNRVYYYRNPAMAGKANFGKIPAEAIRLANTLNSRYRIQCEQDAARLELLVDTGGMEFRDAFASFVTKYIADYRLKSSTAQLLRQRQRRLTESLRGVQVPLITTQMLREAVSTSSEFEQSKLKSLLLRFFRYAKSTGLYPPHLVNPVDDLFIDPLPHKQRQRLTLEQFNAICHAAPRWLQWLMILGFHLALRRVDLVQLRFDNVIGERIVSPIRKTDSQARGMESISVDFPIHPDVRRVLSEARRSSLRLGRCPFIIHREPRRQTRRAREALESGRMRHPAQVLPQFASKTFNRTRKLVSRQTTLFAGLGARELPTLHEIRALSSHMYARAGYEVAAVQELMAHTDPDMTRAYQKGHARKVLRVEMTLPGGLLETDNRVREQRLAYQVGRPSESQEIFPENFLRDFRLSS